MTELDTSEIPVFEGKQAVETAYTSAERNREPFFGIEHYDEGYVVTYDLLPVDRKLTLTAETTVRRALTAEIEAIVGDSDLATAEVSPSVNDSLGNISILASEASARRVAATIAPLVLDRENWRDASK